MANDDGSFCNFGYVIPGQLLDESEYLSEFDVFAL
jgi:hypothetical protein